MQIRGSKADQRRPLADGALPLSLPRKSSVVIPGSPSARRPASAGPYPWPKAEHQAVADQRRPLAASGSQKHLRSVRRSRRLKA